MQAALNKQKKEIESEQLEITERKKSELIVESMRKKRMLSHQMKKLEPSERPDPFKPAKSWYNDRISEAIIEKGSDNCRPCMRKGNPFP